MTRKTYTAEYKTKLVLEAIREESRLEEIAAANEINPNMLRNWKQEFLKNASSVFSQKESKAAKRAEQKKEAALEKEKTTLSTRLCKHIKNKIINPIQFPKGSRVSLE